MQLIVHLQSEFLLSAFVVSNWPRATMETADTSYDSKICCNSYELITIMLKATSVSLFPRTWLYYAKCLNYFRGASIECRDKDKDTPLLMAASKNHLDTIRSLLSHGADIGAKDSNDETPIYRAASEGCIEALGVRWHVFLQTTAAAFWV